ncbi:ROK family protein [Pleomorphomonas oryzae]|uniref:ROK family protein n=1 Tax=Pleomorphomonas oryzae TaxID=261934 RepID=UPI000414B0BC|nr:ROK family protein [Pleomorphomonas oryzae]
MPIRDGVGDTAALTNASDIFSLIATGTAVSRSALLERSGLSRVTVTQRLNALIAADLIGEAAETLPSGGRPTRVLTVNRQVGHVLVANIGESHLHLALMSPDLMMIAQSTLRYEVAEGPTATLNRIADGFRQLQAETGDNGILLGIGLSLPAPVDYKRGRVVGPSVMRGWDDVDIIGPMAAHFDAPVYVDNDVNLMTLYEYRRHFQLADDILYIKVGTGIGAGFIADGKIFRGAHGASGDIGHIQFDSDDPPLCRCGKLGCVEARAAGWAIARDLRALGFKAENARDVIALVDEQVPEAIMLLRKAGRVIGEVTADVVSILNPGLIVVGGTLARGGDFLLSGIRELVYQRCLPLATRELNIVLAPPQADIALLGTGQLVVDNVFSPPGAADLLNRIVASMTRPVADRPEGARRRVRRAG